MRDHSIGGFIFACIIEGIFYVVMGHPEPDYTVMLSIYLAGLIANFLYIGFNKSVESSEEYLWRNEEIMSCFWAALIAGIAPFVLLFIYH